MCFQSNRSEWNYLKEGDSNKMIYRSTHSYIIYTFFYEKSRSIEDNNVEKWKIKRNAARSSSHALRVFRIKAGRGGHCGDHTI